MKENDCKTIEVIVRGVPNLSLIPKDKLGAFVYGLEIEITELLSMDKGNIKNDYERENQK